jgi:hypothetical protein
MEMYCSFITKLRNTIHISCLILLITFVCSTKCKAQDTLYYFIIYTPTVEQKSNYGEEEARNGFIITKDNAESNIYRRDEYLIPFIIAQIDTLTLYDKILLLSEKDTNNKNRLDALNVLSISINPFNKLLEYQFHINAKGLKHNTVSKSNSFFINPDNPEYPNTITTEIQRFFNSDLLGTNSKPTPKIRVDGELVNMTDTIFRSHLDTIILDGLSSSDAETPQQYLIYKWQIKKDTNISNSDPNAFISNFDFSRPKQRIVISEPGTYFVSLKVNDGVAWSFLDTVSINISVINKPVLEVYRRDFNFIIQKSWPFINNKIANTPYNIGYKVDNSKNFCNLRFDYIQSGNKNSKYLLFVNESFFKDTVTHSIFKFSSKLDTTIALKDTFNITGMYIDTSGNANPGHLKFQLKERIPYGYHNYIMYTDCNGVKSNIETVTINLREKSIFTFYAGYVLYKTYYDKDYFNGFNIDVIRYGLRGYITPSLYFDVNYLLPVKTKNFSDVNTQDIGINSLAGDLNYKLYSSFKSNTDLNKSRTPSFLDVFLSYYEIHVPENGIIKAYRQIGLGFKARIQLFINKPQIGVIYLEGDYCKYPRFSEESYSTQRIGINLIYGFWNF